MIRRRSSRRCRSTMTNFARSSTSFLSAGMRGRARCGSVSSAVTSRRSPSSRTGSKDREARQGSLCSQTSPRDSRPLPAMHGPSTVARRFERSNRFAGGSASPFESHRPGNSRGQLSTQRTQRKKKSVGGRARTHSLFFSSAALCVLCDFCVYSPKRLWSCLEATLYKSRLRRYSCDFRAAFAGDRTPANAW